jgi:phenylalanyl-tRNA synthetase beta chain
MERATELLIAITGGEAGPIIDAVAIDYMPVVPQVELRYERVNRLLGIDVKRDEVGGILQRLNMQLVEQADGWKVTPPGYRFDINIEADLIEEIGRLIGYNNIPGTRESSHIKMESFSEKQVSANRIRDILVEQDYFEAITYSFVSPQLQSILDPGQQTLPLANPISSDMSVMRTRLLPGLVQALQHNLNRQQSRVRLFEVGLCFVPVDGELNQAAHIAGIATGSRVGEGLYASTESIDFFDIKGDLETILRSADASEFAFTRSENPILHPGQGADLTFRGEPAGFVGALHPAVLKKLDINQSVFVFEITLSAMLESELPNFGEMSRFPSIRRDISITVAEELPVQALIDSIYSLNYEILQEVFVFDVYTGKEVRNNRKSVALGLILQDFSRTLIDEDVENVVKKVLAQLEEHCNAVLRES